MSERGSIITGKLHANSLYMKTREGLIRQMDMHHTPVSQRAWFFEEFFREEAICSLSAMDEALGRPFAYAS